jgi:hypothetical protein
MKYQHKESGKIYRITRKKKDGAYLILDSFGAYPPRHLSSFTTNQRLKEKYDIINDIGHTAKGSL